MSDIKAQNQTALASVKAIYDAADEANTLLDGMNTAAQAAGTTLDGIYADAVQAASQAQAAQASASNASEYAARALGNLSTVQNVTETLNWITAHGTMTLTSDVALDPTHVYFVRDNNGDYHVGSYYYSVVTEPDVADIATYYELSIDESLNNYVATHLAVDSEGLWIIPDNGGNKVLIAVGGTGHTYNPAGTYVIGKVNNVDTVLASFTADGAQIGQNDISHINMDYHSLQLKDKEGNTYFHISDLRDAEGYVSLKFIGDGTTTTYVVPRATAVTALVNGVESQDVMYFIDQENNTTTVVFDTAPENRATITLKWKPSFVNTKAYTFGIRADDGNIGGFSVAEGYMTIASGIYSHVEGEISNANGYASHAEGTHTKTEGWYAHAEGTITTSSGEASHAEGYYTKAIGHYSHAEGGSTQAIGIRSHAEGFGSKASGNSSHAEGYNTRVNGNYSHAEGYGTEADGNYSHAQNYNTVVGYDNQTAIGKYNDNDSNNAFEIGNGTSTNARSNALTVDWDGNSEQAGHATTKDMTTQEVQDFVDGLDFSGMSLQGVEKKTLLWTNSSPTNAFAGQTVIVDTNYDEYEIVYTGYTAQSQYKKTERLSESDGALTFITGSTGQESGSMYVFKRLVSIASNGISIGEVYSATGSANWTRYTANTGIIPYKIYGIKVL